MLLASDWIMLHGVRSLEPNGSLAAPLIPGIFNYCFRICERCPFTRRCALFLEMENQGQVEPDCAIERHHGSPQRAFEILHAWCEQPEIDFNRLASELDCNQIAELRALDATRSDPLQQRAELYMHVAVFATRTLRHAAPTHTWPEHVREAIDTIALEMILLAAKVHRALSGFVCYHKCLEGDPIQTDWNGSAKVARLLAADSKNAWTMLVDTGRASDEAPIRRVVHLLDEIDDGLARRFPHAMGFVRPGFDQPAIAAARDSR